MKIPLNLIEICLNEPNDNKPISVEIMALCQTGNTPLSESMMGFDGLVSWCIYVSLGLNELGFIIWDYIYWLIALRLFSSWVKNVSIVMIYVADQLYKINQN